MFVCMNRTPPPPLYTPDLLDLVKVTRPGVVTRVRIQDPYYLNESVWIQCGLVSLLRRSADDAWSFAAHLTAAATDCDGGSALAFSFDLVGVNFAMLHEGSARFTAWIRGDDVDAFRVPVPGYSPLVDDSTVNCQSCERSHRVVYYKPPANRDLFEKVRGRRVFISMGPAL